MDQGSFDNLVAIHTSSATAALNQGPNIHTHLLLQIPVHVEYLSPCPHLAFFLLLPFQHGNRRRGCSSFWKVLGQ